MEAAINTYDERKIHLLAYVLAEGLLDEARLEMSWLINSALRDLEAPHIRVLHEIGQQDNWRPDIHNPELGEGSSPIVSTLIRHGLVSTFSGWGGGSTVQLSDFGQTCLRYLSRVYEQGRRLPEA